MDGNLINVSFSIGIAIYPENGQDFESLYLLADRAMYQAKEAGSNTYRFYRDPVH